VDAHRLDDMRPYLWKTTDFGQTWRNLASGMDQAIYLHAVREDPKRRGLLFAGTLRGVTCSIDDGANWEPLRLNLPTVPVHDLVVKDNDLVVGTHGRSIWILDDLTPLREYNRLVAEKDVHLFPAQEAVRYRTGRGGRGREAVGQNPPSGALVHYYLKEKPKGSVTLEVLDAQDRVVTTLSNRPDPDAPPTEDEGFSRFTRRTPLPAEAGVNRAVWDLTHTGAKGIRGAIGWPPPSPMGPTAIPGRYTLRLKVGDKVQSTPLTLRADPRSTVSVADLQTQLDFALEVRDRITRVTQLVMQARSLKTQLAGRNEIWKGNPSARDLAKQAQALTGKLDALEGRLHNPKAEINYDLLAHKGGAKLASQLYALFYAAMGGDGAPTQGMREVYAEHRRELEQLEAELNGLIGNDLAQLNRRAKDLDLLNIAVPPAAEPTKRGEGKR
jgi:hypothetical protein